MLVTVLLTLNRKRQTLVFNLEFLIVCKGISKGLDSCQGRFDNVYDLLRANIKITARTIDNTRKIGTWTKMKIYIKISTNKTEEGILKIIAQTRALWISVDWINWLKQEEESLLHMNAVLVQLENHILTKCLSSHSLEQTKLR